MPCKLEKKSGEITFNWSGTKYILPSKEPFIVEKRDGTFLLKTLNYDKNKSLTLIDEEYLK